MDSAGKELRMFLYELIYGEDSPDFFYPDEEVLKYLLTRSPRLITTYFVELEFDIPLKIKLVSLKTEEHLTGRSHIKNIFITQEDKLRDKSQINESNITLRAKLRAYVLKKYLITESDLGEYYEDVLFDNSYKCIFNKIKFPLEDMELDELRLEYYRIYLQDLMYSFRAKLEPYFEPIYHKEYFEIIQFYQKKIRDDVSQQETRNKDCFELIYKSLQWLNDSLKEYYGLNSQNVELHYEKLEWNSSFEDFIDFFKQAIQDNQIKHEDSNQFFPIFKILLHHFYIKENPNITDKKLCDNLGLSADCIIPVVLTDKLNWIGSWEKLANYFNSQINFPLPQKSNIQIGSTSRNAVAKKLSEIFLVKKQNDITDIYKESTLAQYLRTSF